VLAAPAPDHQDVHPLSVRKGHHGPAGYRGRLCSRAGPTPTTEIGTPPSSSRNRT
jgi:hypothetical protein